MQSCTVPSPQVLKRAGAAVDPIEEDADQSVGEPDLDALESALQDAYAKLDAAQAALDAIAKAAGFNVDDVSCAVGRSVAASPAEHSEESDAESD